MSFCIDNDQKSIKPFGIRLKILKNVELNALTVYDDR